MGTRVTLGGKLPPGGHPPVMPKTRLIAYADAIKLFRKTFADFRTELDREYMLRIVLEACAAAEAYIAKGGDDYHKQRENDSEAIKSLPDQSAALKSIRAFARAHPRQAGLALAVARFRGCGDVDEGKSLNVAFIELLDRYEKSLPDFSKKGVGPWMHRVAFGNLIFAKPVDSRKKHPTVATGLLFQLVLYLRNFTAGEGQFGAYQNGQTMPDWGKPHYKVASAFVQTASGEEIDDPGARLLKLIKENPGIGLGGWPAT